MEKKKQDQQLSFYLVLRVDCRIIKDWTEAQVENNGMKLLN
jgi:hypothetical protein